MTLPKLVGIGIGFVFPRAAKPKPKRRPVSLRQGNIELVANPAVTQALDFQFCFDLFFLRSPIEMFWLTQNLYM